MFDPHVASYFVNPVYQRLPGDSQPIVNPSTLEIEGQITNTSLDVLHETVLAVSGAQQLWRRLDAKTRAARLHELAQRIESNDMRACAQMMTREMGKPYPEALGEINNCAPVFRYFAEMARDEAGKVAGTTQAGSFQFARYEPLGVSVHIMPFNFPILLMCWTVAASLAAGNGCVVKPAPVTTLSTLMFMALFEDLPANLIACIPGDAGVGQALIESEHTDAVAFTGSVSAAKAVAVTAAQHMMPAIVEAGGSDPLIISAHASLDVAVPGAVTAAFHLSGQVCTSAERIYVVDDCYDAFIQQFKQATAALRIGDGLSKAEIGPLVSEDARTRVQRLVDEAVEQGANILLGGRVPADQPTGWFYEPTIVTDVTDDMSLMRQECFGPVAAVQRVKDFNEALDKANNSPFGLGASVFTTQLNEAMQAAEQLEAGMVWVNNPLIDNDALPFGGWKQSGLGRELSRLGLDAFRRSKMVIIDHNPTVQEWWYPYDDDWFFDGGGREF